jgi:hypothetical protein
MVIPWVVITAGAAHACLPAAAPFSRTLLDVHNAYRRAVAVAPVGWSDDLACGARDWAEHLLALGGETLEHAEGSAMRGLGENLWLGSAGDFTLLEMVNDWGAEGRGYTGQPVSYANFQAIGHFTQMVWRDTREVGCGIARGAGTEILVCRYRPAGNMLGRRPY